MLKKINQIIYIINLHKMIYKIIILNFQYDYFL